MRKLIGILAFGLVVLGASPAAQANDALSRLNWALFKQTTQTAAPLYLIDWKVGDEANFKVSMMIMEGTMKKFVDKNEGDALWMRQEIKMMGQNEVIEVLMDRNTGKVLKYVRNGKEEQLPDDQVELISQDYAEVTVPAGTFKSVHILAKSKQISKIELWMNPQETVMEGTLKMIMDSGMMGDVTMELVNFKHGQ